LGLFGLGALPPPFFFPDYIYRPARVNTFPHFIFPFWGPARPRASPGPRGAPKGAKIIKIGGVSLGKSGKKQNGASESSKIDWVSHEKLKVWNFHLMVGFPTSTFTEKPNGFCYFRGQKSDSHCKR